MIGVNKINPKEINIPAHRIREDLGDIEQLARQIETAGQIQPIIIDDNYTLIAGYRRLMACKKLDKNVLAIKASDIGLNIETDAGRKKIELIENIGRKQLDWKEEIIAIDEFHQAMINERGQRVAGPGVQFGWAFIDTAKVLGFKSHASISEASKIAKHLRENPESFKNIKNMHSANRKIREIEGAGIESIHLPSSRKYKILHKNTSIFYNNKLLQLKRFNNENDFENYINQNNNIIFGKNSYFLNIKTKISSEIFTTIPDAFLLDLSKDPPKLYFVEIEISSHTINHISGHITKYNDTIDNSHDLRKIVEILSNQFESEFYRKINIAASYDNCGILIILDKEDIKIESLLKAKPEGLKNYKIMTIESYENQENDNILIRNEFYLPSLNTKRKLERSPEINMDEFD